MKQREREAAHYTSSPSAANTLRRQQKEKEEDEGEGAVGAAGVKEEGEGELGRHSRSVVGVVRAHHHSGRSLSQTPLPAAMERSIVTCGWGNKTARGDSCRLAKN
jgi:hypothetical protein